MFNISEEFNKTWKNEIMTEGDYTSISLRWLSTIIRKVDKKSEH